MEYAEELDRLRYLVVEGDDDTVEGVARRLGRIGRWQRVKPQPPDKARPRTFSATFGFETFPWHTDGAIARVPPHFVVLRTHSANSTPTELLDPELHPNLSRALRSTVLRVRDRRSRVRYECGYVGGGGAGRYRWDPVHCSPITGTTPRVLVEECLQPDYVVKWEAGMSVIFDNWRLLHRRARLTEADRNTRSLDRLYIYPSEA